MGLELYNTLGRKKEAFIPTTRGHVKIYSCGPTVYDTAHIGNLRTFVMNDILRRSLDYLGYKVEHAMNITDVDDKTIKKSIEEKVPLSDITRRYEEAFFEDLKALNILPPQKVLRATEHVLDMIDFINALIKKGVAYPTKDGVYLSIGSIPNYGELAQIQIDISGNSDKSNQESRINNDEYEKENPRDFALWKFGDKNDGEAVWEAPFGNGRPGWHIECSAMAIKALGPTIDIHTGGTDLIFPHHTNEIAQSEALTGQKYVRYWVHGGFMNIEDEKMSKSKGNFLKLRDLSSEGISPLSFRYWLLTSHYRSMVNFSFEAVTGAQQAFLRLARHIVDWNDESSASGRKIDTAEDKKTADLYKKDFFACIENDLDMPGAIALVWKIVKDDKLSNKSKKELIFDMDKVFGLGLHLLATIDIPQREIPLEIQVLGEAREEARRSKDWEKSDALRAEIEERGYKIIDKDGGFEIKEA